MANTFNIAVSGLNAATARIAASANNIANGSSKGKVPTESNPEPTSYQPVRAVTLPVTGNGMGLGVRSTLQPLTESYHVGYDPNSPHANEKGEVAITSVDLATEIVEMTMAEAAYKANAKVIAVAKEMEEYLIDELA